MTFENKLPSGYTTGTIDLDGDKKLSLRLYAAAAAVAVAGDEGGNTAMVSPGRSFAGIMSIPSLSVKCNVCRADGRHQPVYYSTGSF